MLPDYLRSQPRRGREPEYTHGMPGRQSSQNRTVGQAAWQHPRCKHASGEAARARAPTNPGQPQVPLDAEALSEGALKFAAKTLPIGCGCKGMV